MAETKREITARGIYVDRTLERCANCDRFVDINKQGFCDSCGACLNMTCNHCQQEMPVLEKPPLFCSSCGEPVDISYRPLFGSSNPILGSIDPKTE